MVRRTLNRLLRLRELEEEVSRMQLELAVVERDRIHQGQMLAQRRQQEGRRSFVAGVLQQNQQNRTGGILEIESARRQQLHLQSQLEAADSTLAQREVDFLMHRTARRQVETLVDKQRDLAQIERGRRAQQMMDDWYGRRDPRQNRRDPSGE